MSKKPEIIELSSDSESDQGGWLSYFPPKASSSSKELIFYEEAQALTPLAVGTPLQENDDQEEDDDDEIYDKTYQLAEELPNALSQALASAISGLKAIPVPEKAAPRPKPPKQVLCLPSPKWLAMQTSQKVHKTKHDYKGKGKRPME